MILDYDQNILSRVVNTWATTNGIAEYYGYVRIALERALSLDFAVSIFRVDNLCRWWLGFELTVLSWQKWELWPLFERIRNLILKFERVKFSHIKGSSINWQMVWLIELHQISIRLIEMVYR